MSLFPRIAVLVDLPREAGAGGHVKYWERLAFAAVKNNAPVDLTLYFSGTQAEEVLSPHVRFRFLPPVFSTAKLKFLPYVPAHTDLASFHPALAADLPEFDVIHTTDGFFAFAQTAEKIARWNNIPLVTSFHTDTPSYAELFTRQTLHSLFGNRVGAWLDRTFHIAKRERASKEKRLNKHLRACRAVLAMRPEDIASAHKAENKKIMPMRLGVDKDLFAPQADARAVVERAHNIEPEKFIALFVGRVDAGKNMPLLMQACAHAVAQGTPLHLIVVGQGPLCKEVKDTLGDNVTVAGLQSAEELSRLYAAADCLAMASDIEIGGMIALEALASGCPVLVSRKCGAAQLFGDTKAMQQVESTIGAWTVALIELANDKERQTKMRADALALRHDHLADWNDVLMQDFLPIWQSVCNKEAL